MLVIVLFFILSPVLASSHIALVLIIVYPYFLLCMLCVMKVYHFIVNCVFLNVLLPASVSFLADHRVAYLYLYMNFDPSQCYDVISIMTNMK